MITRAETGRKHKRCRIFYKISTGGNGNLVPLSILRYLFPNTIGEQFRQIRDKYIVLKTYKKKVSHNLEYAMCKFTTTTTTKKKKQLTCKFFLVPGNGLSFLDF